MELDLTNGLVSASLGRDNCGFRVVPSVSTVCTLVPSYLGGKRIMPRIEQPDLITNVSNLEHVLSHDNNIQPYAISFSTRKTGK